jgi:hypothetical protein
VPEKPSLQMLWTFKFLNARVVAGVAGHKKLPMNVFCH